MSPHIPTIGTVGPFIGLSVTSFFFEFAKTLVFDLLVDGNVIQNHLKSGPVLGHSLVRSLASLILCFRAHVMGQWNIFVQFSKWPESLWTGDTSALYTKFRGVKVGGLGVVTRGRL